jgi:hypothetical protein
MKITEQGTLGLSNREVCSEQFSAQFAALNCLLRTFTTIRI